jgi:hypothetical protein
MPNPNNRTVDATPLLGEVLDSYGALDYMWHQAIGEFVDNSYDSFEKNSDEIIGDWEIDISYEARNGLFRIRDNAFGMNLDDLSRAIKLAKPNLDDTGIGKYGLGMKTAASWIGRVWSVKTKKKGEALEWTARVDIDALKESGGNSIPFTSKVVTSDLDSHYTIVEIKQMRRKMPGRSMGKVKENLKFLYGPQIHSGKMKLRWGPDLLEYVPPNFMEDIDSAGNPTTWISNLPDDFSVEGYSIKGRYGMLSGGEDVPHAGITLLWRNRVIIGGHRSGWKPDGIFGSGQGDLARQRVWAEIHLDCLEPNQQKKGFIWKEFNRDDLEEALSPYLVPIAREARDHRRRGTKVPSQGQMKIADEQVKGALESDEIAMAMQESTKAAQRPAPVLKEEVAAAIEAAAPAPLRISVNDGEPTVMVYRDPDEHQNTAFMRTLSPSHDLIKLYMNVNHRFFSDFIGDSRESYELWQHICIALSLVQFNADKLPNDPDPAQFMVMLNEILKYIERQI